MNVLYNLFTNQVTGFDREQFPAEGLIELPYPITLSKTVEQLTGNMVQKVNDQGWPLYKKDETVDDTGLATYVETIESREPIAWREVLHTYRVQTGSTTEDSTDELGNPIQIEVPIYDETTNVVNEPTEWIEYEPLMIQEVLLRTYTFKQHPTLFTTDEVLAAKDQSIIDAKNAPPTEIKKLQEDVLTNQGALDFIIMNF